MKNLWENIKAVLLVSGLILGAWFIMCVSTHNACSSDVKQICSFFCEAMGQAK